MAFDENLFSNYFKEPNGSIVENNAFISKNNESFLKTLERLFDLKLKCDLFDSVINGLGNEKEKITKKYSSSLQSFLIFSQVSENNTLSINGVSYDEVRFEYKNKVFGYPSCIDVVLLSKTKRKILFIESKLAEIIRDSSDKGSYEIGPSYFCRYGYPRIIEQKEKLKEIGINFPLPEDYGISNSSKIKSDICKLRKSANEKGRKGYISVEKINNEKYVYSYGIKQILSHVIGITNFKDSKIGSNCDNYLNANDFDEVSFLEIHNNLPNIPLDVNESRVKIKNFVKHVEDLSKIIKKSICNFSQMSYQELFLFNPDYFKKGKLGKVVSFYHLNEANRDSEYLCPRCGAKMINLTEGPYIHWKCSNCEVEIASFDYKLDSPIKWDNKQYSIILKSDLPNKNKIEVISKTSGLNYIQSRNIISQGGLLCAKRAIEIQKISAELKKSNINFLISPKFPYSF